MLCFFFADDRCLAAAAAVDDHSFSAADVGEFPLSIWCSCKRFYEGLPCCVIIMFSMQYTM